MTHTALLHSSLHEIEQRGFWFFYADGRVERHELERELIGRPVTVTQPTSLATWPPPPQLRPSDLYVDNRIFYPRLSHARVDAKPFISRAMARAFGVAPEDLSLPEVRAVFRSIVNDAASYDPARYHPELAFWRLGCRVCGCDYTDSGRSYACRTWMTYHEEKRC